jgi:endonuclease YncB( thermonuclease family)
MCGTKHPGRVLTLVLFLLVGCAPSFGQERLIEGKVVQVLDGDSIMVEDAQQRQYIIRVAGIDAPELDQDHGKRSRKFLAGLVGDKVVSVSTSRMDRNGELVGRVLLFGRDVGLEMIMAGHAWHYKKFQNEQSERDRQLFEGAELHARKSRFNLWSANTPTPPWEFRKEPSEPQTVELRPLSAPPSTVGREETKVVPMIPAPAAAATKAEDILGNKNSKIYHWPGCPGYTRIAEHNRVTFRSRAEAEAAGYRAAKNCAQ